MWNIKPVKRAAFTISSRELGNKSNIFRTSTLMTSNLPNQKKVSKSALLSILPYELDVQSLNCVTLKPTQT